MPYIFPFVSYAPNTIPNENRLPVFREYAYDFEHNCLLLRAGLPYLIERDEALKVWVFHALKVPRYAWRAHSREYGSELEKVIGLTGSREVLHSEIRRYITEAVMVNPYIQELADFRFTHEAALVKVVFEVTTVYGRFTHESEIYNE